MSRLGSVQCGLIFPLYTDIQLLKELGTQLVAASTNIHLLAEFFDLVQSPAPASAIQSGGLDFQLFRVKGGQLDYRESRALRVLNHREPPDILYVRRRNK